MKNFYAKKKIFKDNLNKLMLDYNNNLLPFVKINFDKLKDKIYVVNK
jgi:hypothetical protein